MENSLSKVLLRGMIIVVLKWRGSSLAEGVVEYGDENICQLDGACSDGLSRDVV